MAAVVASRRDPLPKVFRDRVIERIKTPVQTVVKTIRKGDEPFYGQKAERGKEREA